jgi:hypothetical protein
LKKKKKNDRLLNHSAVVVLQNKWRNFLEKEKKEEFQQACFGDN